MHIRQNLVTTYEAIFYMGGSYGRRRVCNVRRNETDPSGIEVRKHNAFAPGFMVWARVSFYVKISPILIDKGIKVNALSLVSHR